MSESAEWNVDPLEDGKCGHRGALIADVAEVRWPRAARPNTRHDTPSSLCVVSTAFLLTSVSPRPLCCAAAAREEAPACQWWRWIGTILFSVFCKKLITWMRPFLPLSLLPPSLRGELKLARLRPPLACERRPRLPPPTYTHTFISGNSSRQSPTLNTCSSPAAGRAGL
jgi:hypothetical protein